MVPCPATSARRSVKAASALIPCRWAMFWMMRCPSGVSSCMTRPGRCWTKRAQARAGAPVDTHTGSAHARSFVGRLPLSMAAEQKTEAAQKQDVGTRLSCEDSGQGGRCGRTRQPWCTGGKADTLHLERPRRPARSARRARLSPRRDVLVTWKLDRLGRSLPHRIETVKETCRDEELPLFDGGAGRTAGWPGSCAAAGRAAGRRDEGRVQRVIQ